MAQSQGPDQLPFTHQDRIRELSSIETDVTNAVAAAGESLQTLSGADGSKKLSSEEIRDAFEASTKQFLHSIQAVGARLRRQVYALEEAGVIPPTREAERIETSASPPPGAAGAGGAPGRSQQGMIVTNAGMGNFDVGTLNSKRDAVGKRKEAELWKEARDLLADLHGGGDDDSSSNAMDIDSS